MSRISKTPGASASGVAPIKIGNGVVVAEVYAPLLGYWFAYTSFTPVTAKGYTLFRDTPDFSACDSFGGGRRLLLGEPSANTPYPLA